MYPITYLENIHKGLDRSMANRAKSENFHKSTIGRFLGMLYLSFLNIFRQKNTTKDIGNTAITGITHTNSGSYRLQF